MSRVEHAVRRACQGAALRRAARGARASLWALVAGFAGVGAGCAARTGAEASPDAVAPPAPLQDRSAHLAPVDWGGDASFQAGSSLWTLIEPRVKTTSDDTTSSVERTLAPGPGGTLLASIRRKLPAIGDAPGGTRELELRRDGAGVWRIAELIDPTAAMTARFEPPVLLKPAGPGGPIVEEASVEVVRDGTRYSGTARAAVSQVPPEPGAGLAGVWALRHEMTIKVGPSRTITTTTSTFGADGQAIIERRELVVRVLGVTIVRDTQVWRRREG